MARQRKPTLLEIRANPILHPRAFALARERFPSLSWHRYAHSPDSSQAFTLSAFLPLLEFPDKDAILDALATQALPNLPQRPGRIWKLAPEYGNRHVLREAGGEATRVDILLAAEDAVVCVESKFRVDAREGWGRCSQPGTLLCNGYFGAGSDRKGTRARCRLETADGNRGPRLYWQVGLEHFREGVFAEQEPGRECPFYRDYQLVRNFLFAAEYAAWTGREHFGVLAMAPAGRSLALEEGVRRFREGVLLPHNRPHVALATYEEYVAILAGGSAPARGLAEFLGHLLR